MSSVSDERMREVIQKMLNNFNAEKGLGIVTGKPEIS